MSSNKSFTVFAERVGSDIAFDCLAMVKNNASVQSGLLIGVEAINVDFPSPFGIDLTNLLGNQGKISLNKIAGYVGGTELASYKFDTNSPSVSSLVKFMSFPDSVVFYMFGEYTPAYDRAFAFAPEQKVRQIGDVFSFGMLQTISFQAQFRAPGVCDASESGRNVDGHNVLHKAAFPPKISPSGSGEYDASFGFDFTWVPNFYDYSDYPTAMILREGEGIAAIQRVFGLPQAHHWSVTVRMISNGTGQYTNAFSSDFCIGVAFDTTSFDKSFTYDNGPLAPAYRYMATNMGSPYCENDPIWCLYNGVGSGVVLEVNIVNFTDMGESNIPRYRIMRSGGVINYGSGGKEITPVAHDTSMDISSIKAYAGPLKAYALAGDQGVPINYLDYQGSPIAIALQQKADTFRQFLHTDPFITELVAPKLRFENATERWPGDRRGVGAIADEIILHPGECIAVVGGGNGLIETSEGAYANVFFLCRLYSDAVSFPVVGNTGLVKVA